MPPKKKARVEPAAAPPKEKEPGINVEYLAKVAETLQVIYTKWPGIEAHPALPLVAGRGELYGLVCPWDDAHFDAQSARDKQSLRYTCAQTVALSDARRAFIVEPRQAASPDVAGCRFLSAVGGTHIVEQRLSAAQRLYPASLAMRIGPRFVLQGCGRHYRADARAGAPGVEAHAALSAMLL